MQRVKMSVDFFDLCIDSYLNDCRLRGLSEHTLNAYASDIRNFRNFLSTQQIVDVHYIQDVNVVDFIAHLRYIRRFEETSVRRHKVCILRLFKFLESEEFLENNPIRIEMPSKELRRFKSYIPSVEEMAVLLNVIRNAKPRGPRDKIYIRRDYAMMMVLYGTGMRVSELVSLTDGDIDENKIRVIGKGNKERHIPLIPTVRNSIQEYHEVLGEKPSPIVFLSNRGSAMSRVNVWYRLQKYCEGLEFKLSPHGLRHACATHLLHSGMNLIQIQTLLGHEDITTTQIYTHMTTETLIKEHDIHHPRSN